MEARTANLRKPNTQQSAIRIRAANDNGTPVTDLREVIFAKLNEPEWAPLAGEVVKAFIYGTRLAKRLQEGGSTTVVVGAARQYVALRDDVLDTTRQQMFFLLCAVYVGAELEEQALRAQRYYQDPWFAD